MVRGGGGGGGGAGGGGGGGGGGYGVQTPPPPPPRNLINCYHGFPLGFVSTELQRKKKPHWTGPFTQGR